MKMAVERLCSPLRRRGCGLNGVRKHVWRAKPLLVRWLTFYLRDLALRIGTYCTDDEDKVVGTVYVL